MHIYNGPMVIVWKNWNEEMDGSYEAPILSKLFTSKKHSFQKIVFLGLCDRNEMPPRKISVQSKGIRGKSFGKHCEQ